jgi:hypothetical protein
MLKRLIPITAIVLASSLAFALDAGAGSRDRGKDGAAVSGARCVKAGVRFLIKNDLLLAAARQQVDYDTIDSDSGGGEGLINTDLPSPAFLPLGTVVALHYTNPELFDWCLKGSGRNDEDDD